VRAGAVVVHRADVAAVEAQARARAEHLAPGGVGFGDEGEGVGQGAGGWVGGHGGFVEIFFDFDFVV